MARAASVGERVSLGRSLRPHSAPHQLAAPHIQHNDVLGTHTHGRLKKLVKESQKVATKYTCRCKAAASRLGFTYDLQMRRLDRPPGCYEFRGKLYLNLAQSQARLSS